MLLFDLNNRQIFHCSPYLHLYLRVCPTHLSQWATIRKPIRKLFLQLHRHDHEAQVRLAMYNIARCFYLLQVFFCIFLLLLLLYPSINKGEPSSKAHPLVRIFPLSLLIVLRLSHDYPIPNTLPALHTFLLNHRRDFRH